MSVAVDARGYVHPQALCEAAVGAGTRVWAFAHVMSGAIVGTECNIGEHAFIESGARIGNRVTVKNGAMVFYGVTIADEVFIGPDVVFTNDRTPRSPRVREVQEHYAQARNWLTPTFVGRGASLGAGVVVVAGVTIGAFAMVGAGAVVTKDIPSHCLVVGQPAKPLGWVCACGTRVTDAAPCERCGRLWRVECDSLVFVE